MSKKVKKEDTEAFKELKELSDKFKAGNIPEENWYIHLLLRNLGLTKYESQAYIALVEYGNMSVSELVKVAGIPHPRAYDTLRSLEKYGLVAQRLFVDPEISKTKKRMAQKYRALKPKTGLENIFSYFTFAKDEAIKSLNKLAKNRVADEKEIYEIYGRKNIINFVGQSIQKTKCELILCIPFSFITNIIDPIKQLCDTKNSNISCVFNKDIEVDEKVLSECTKYIKMKLRKSFPMPYIIIDRSLAIHWKFNTFTQENLDPDLIQAQVIEKTDLIDTLIDHFFNLNWRVSKQVFMQQEGKYPRSFIHSINLVEEIEYNMNKGRILTLEVTGHKLKGDQDEPIQVKGQVTRYLKNYDDAIFSVYIRTDEGEEYSIGGPTATIEDVALESAILDIIM